MLRLAVIGSPRSGNTWVRGLLGCLYQAYEIAIDRPEDLDWNDLPDRFVLQIHQYPDPAFDRLLERHGIQVVVPARHTLDLLISSLNYSQYIANPLRWTDRRGVERTLLGATPLSEAFLEYASGAHPGAAPSYSPAWWERPGVIGVRYEELVADTAGVLGRVVARLPESPLKPVAEVVSTFDIKRRRANLDVWQYHFGLGQPGIWRKLIPARIARQIAEYQHTAFRVLGHACDPDEGLDDIHAEANWLRLQTQLLRRHLEDEWARHKRTKEALESARTRSDTEAQRGGEGTMSRRRAEGNGEGLMRHTGRRARGAVRRVRAILAGTSH